VGFDEALSDAFDDMEVTLLDLSGSLGVGLEDLEAEGEIDLSGGLDFGGTFDVAFSEVVTFATLLDAAFEGLAGVGLGFFGLGEGFKVSGALDDRGFGEAFGFFVGFGALLLGFLVLLLGGFGSTPSPGFALLSPKPKHFETRSHSRS
jgi:hypothetical protein